MYLKLNSTSGTEDATPDQDASSIQHPPSSSEDRVSQVSFQHLKSGSFNFVAVLEMSGYAEPSGLPTTPAFDSTLSFLFQSPEGTEPGQVLYCTVHLCKVP